MDETSVFGLDPDQLDELLSLGSDLVDQSGPDRKANSPGHSEIGLKPPGSRIGQYRLLRVLGEGGMGIVYRARQEQPIKRDVALKIIKPGMDSKRVIARFEAERQALALLDHPNIAHVYDAGTTEEARPYFVMEYVKGLPITEYCDYHKLTIEDRLNLFQQVCLAVHHAHQKGIIHRDIKPSNILVLIQDDQAVPKIIDFGVAKAIVQPLTERTLITEEGQLFGTPEYMSPEQADMINEDIDIRSDIYSLGVLLYVLLTGCLPFDSDTLRTGGIEHIRKVIRETDPKTPSTRLTQLGEKAAAIAQNRRMEIQTLRKHLRKELEWIPLKAMRKDRTERYRSASELADDIDNYLKGAPLLAGPPTAGYRLRKSLRRHKALVGGIAAVLVVSVIGIIVSMTFAVGQARARAEAERQARTSQAVTDFLTRNVLNAIGSVQGSEDMTTDVFYAAITKLLDIASQKLNNRINDSPIVEAEIHYYLANAYWRIRGASAAISHFSRSYELRRELFGERHRLTVLAKYNLAMACGGARQYNKSEQLYKELIEKSYRPEWECNLALMYLQQGRYAEAERLFVKNLKTDTPWWKSWHDPNKVPYIEDLAIVYLRQGRYEEAETLFNQFMDEQGDEVIEQAELVQLGYVYIAQERYKEAADLFTRGIEHCNRKYLGNGHPLTLGYMNGLAVLRTKQKQYEVAERLFYEVLETRSLRLGDDHPDTLQTKNDIAMMCKEQGRYEKAEPLLLEALEGRRLKLGDTHPHTLESWHNLINVYEAWNKPEEAEKWRERFTQTEAAKE